MYVWIWRRIPGDIPGKLFGSFLLFLGVVALLFFVVFPRVQNSLPFNDVTINQNGSHSSVTPTPSP
jgi:hypothetical protein